MKLSHTQHQTYKECSYKWMLHYNEKLRSTKIGSALIFGKALDDAFNRILLEKKQELTQGEQLLMKVNEFDSFNSSFQTTIINGEAVDVSKTLNIEYFKSDLDLTLLLDEDKEEIYKEVNDNTLDLQDFVSLIQADIKAKKDIDNQERLLYNYICWLSLRRKGHMLINAYREQILPQIEAVYSIQESVSLPDENHEFIGYIDFIASFSVRPGVKFIVDNKTSSRSYTQTSADESEQLAVYSEYKNIPNVAFVVLHKTLRKKDPKVRTQVIFGRASEELINNTFTDIGVTLDSIERKDFTKNWESCYSYGRPCQFYRFCRTRDLSNLIYLEKKNG